MQEEPIAAVATAPGEGAVGIVRLSGEGAVGLADRVFRSLHGKASLKSARDRMLLHGVARDPASGRTVDEVLVVVARGPRSYTGEDVVEFFCHGGRAAVGAILSALIAVGARPARPGEFTLRAFLNGRMDLVQAEAVADVVSARSRQALGSAVSGVLGGLTRRVAALKEELLATAAHLEAALDFAEEEVPPLAWEEVQGRLESIRAGLRELLGEARLGRLYREGLRVVLAGRPNVGKSSLLNALLGRERAIVAPVPGTTRDTLEETAVVEGVPLCLVDTAGLRAGGDAIEREGVHRARREIGEAQVVVLVLDGSEPLRADDREAAAEVTGRPAVVAVNKRDLAGAVSDQEAGALLPGRTVLRVSARTGEGLEDLTRAVLAAGTAAGGGPAGLEGAQDTVVTRARQEEALRRAEGAVDRALKEARGRREELVAAQVRQALYALGELTGENVDDDLLERLFATFCVGK